MYTCLTLSRYILQAEYGHSVFMGQSRQRSVAPVGLKKTYVPYPVLHPLPYSGIQMTQHTLFSALKRLRDPKDDTFKHLQVKNSPISVCSSATCFNYAIYSTCILLFFAVYLRAPAQWCIRSMSWHDLAKRENELSASFLQFPRTNEWAKW